MESDGEGSRQPAVGWKENGSGRYWGDGRWAVSSEEGWKPKNMNGEREKERESMPSTVGKTGAGSTGKGEIGKESVVEDARSARK
jgi:hypothetical protein